MLSIGSELPADTSSFRDAIARGLASLALDPSALTLDGEFPQFSAVRVNLSNGRAKRPYKLNRAAGQKEPLCFVRNVQVSGDPVHVENIPLAVSLQAEDVVVDQGDAAEGGGKVLALGKAGKGTLELSAKRADLEAAMFALGHAAAKEKGAELQGVTLELESISSRSLRIRAVVTAKAMFFTTTVTVSGKFSIDDELNGRLSELNCEGDGMIGKMAANALSAQFQKLESRVIPLGQAIGGMALSDITITGGDTLQIRAHFGAQS